MTDTDRTLLVLVMALIPLTYAACVLALEGYRRLCAKLRDLRVAFRRWRIKRIYPTYEANGPLR